MDLPMINLKKSSDSCAPLDFAAWRVPSKHYLWPSNHRDTSEISTYLFNIFNSVPYPCVRSIKHNNSDPGPSLHSIRVQDVAELASDPPGFITLNLQTGHRPSLTTDVVPWSWREPPLEIATLKWRTATTSSGTPVTLQLDSTMILVVAEGLCQAWRLRMTEPGGSEARCVT